MDNSEQSPAERSPAGPSQKANHLCILVHGLWGNPGHLAYLASSLRNKFSEDKLHILVAKTNSGTFTYDGIETGAERVTQEIETCLEELGTTVQKLSIVGYSLGGLVARYAIGLLYSRGWFDKIQPVNFTTFATPHLGVRTPLRGYHSRLWNVFGSRTLSKSGRQLFTIDSFRDTGRPILVVLADPDSIFVRALSLFKHRTLYANIINDRSAPYYTTAITCTDPYIDLSTLNISYLERFSPIILDPAQPAVRKPVEAPLPFYTRVSNSTQALAARIPLYALLLILIPIGSVVWTVNSGIQSFRSSKRIRLHEQRKATGGYSSYRIPLLVSENAQSAANGAFENLNRVQSQEYLSQDSEEIPFAEDTEEDEESPEKPLLKRQTSGSELKRTTSRKSDFPVLALSQEQFLMIRNLDEVGWRKYLVHIHNVRHTHAAIIVRSAKPSFEEGKVVVRHWLDEEFEI
ncbi:MAG: hypothetical protein Q9167_002487 [Letrouitia subvulpina]